MCHVAQLTWRRGHRSEIQIEGLTEQWKVRNGPQQWRGLFLNQSWCLVSFYGTSCLWTCDLWLIYNPTCHNSSGMKLASGLWIRRVKKSEVMDVCVCVCVLSWSTCLSSSPQLVELTGIIHRCSHGFKVCIEHNMFQINTRADDEELEPI